MPARRVVITGLGVISPVGQTASEFFVALATGRSGIRLVDPGISPGGRPFVAGQVDFDPSAFWPPHRASQYDRATQFALAAVRQAVEDASLVLGDEESFRAGVYWGTGLGGAESIEESYRNLFAGNGRVRPTSVVLGMNNAAAGQISIVHGLRGPLLNVSTACASSAAAIGEAFHAVRDGYADVIVAGGSEALITEGNLAAWDAMRALAQPDLSDPPRSCKPFSADRSGLVLGEGAAALVVENAERAALRGARVYAELVGYGNASDASHISKPDAGGQVRAMRAALADARLEPADVDYVNAHGTATLVGDVVETAALKQVFGDRTQAPCVSSTKAVHGHLMGATGALETVASVLAIRHGVIPPTAHLDHSDPECDLDYVPNTMRSMDVQVAMTNSFGFGGMNAVVVVRGYQANRA